MQLLLLSPVNCSDPTAPENGSIVPYQNTTEGAEIFFICNPGFVPAGRMTSTCACNGMWTPDPGSLTCICEYPLGCKESLGTKLYTHSYTWGGKCKLQFQDVL